MATTKEYNEQVSKDSSGDTKVYRERERVDSTAPARYPSRYYAYRRYSSFRIIYYLLNILEVFLGLRFLLRLLAANPGSPFVNFIYQLTAPFVSPFRGIFAPAVSQGTVVEWSTIIAMIIYALVVYAVVRLIDIATSNPV